MFNWSHKLGFLWRMIRRPLSHFWAGWKRRSRKRERMRAERELRAMPAWMPRPIAFESLDNRRLLSAAVPHDDGAINVALIDRTLPQSRDLIGAALGTTRVIVFDGRVESARDVLGRVAALADDDGRPVSSLSVFSHGAIGQFALGNEWINAGNVTETADDWKSIRDVLGTNATVQLYGCNTADGVSGRKLLDRLSEYTGAAVFGSTNISGFGGDWDLELESRVGRENQAAATFSDAAFPLDQDRLADYRGQLVWIGATSGATFDAAHTYNNTANWSGGVIDDSFSTRTLTGALTLYLTADRTTTASGMNFGYAGTFDLTLRSSSATPRTITLNGPISGDFGGTSDRSVSIGTSAGPVNVSVAATQTLTVTDGGDTLHLANTVSGAGGLSKAGAGELTLWGSNTYTGGTTLSAGTLNINTAAAIGTGTLTISNGSIGNTSGSPITLSTNNAQVWSGDFTFDGSGALNLGTGAVTMAATRSLTMVGSTLTVGGNIAGGANTLNVDGAGTLILSGSNTLGSVVVDSGVAGAGTVRAASSNALGTGTIMIGEGGNGTTGRLELSGGITLANPITFNGRVTAGSIGIQSVSGANALTGTITGQVGGNYYVLDVASGAGLTLSNATSLTQLATGARAWTLQGAGTGTVGGIIVNGTAVVAVTKSGSGTWTLAGANTYTGDTTISAGVLLANNSTGSATGTGAISIASGATLGGTGAVSGAVSVATGGSLAPGSGSTTGTLETGSVTAPTGATVDFNINGNTAGSTYDQLSVTGSVNLTGSTLDETGTRPAATGVTITLINNDGADAVVGTFAGLAQNATFTGSGGALYRISYTGGTGNDVVLIDITPAPPVAVDDSVVTPVNTPATVNVVGNDTDANGDAITVRDVRNPTNGTVTASGGSVTYTPTAGYIGPDTFDYLAADNNDGITHYWKLDGNANDSIGASHGTRYNSPTTVAGYYGSAQSFDEVNDYISVPDFSYNAGFTVSFRFKVDSNAGTAYQYIYSHGALQTTNSIAIRIGESGNTIAGYANMMLTDFRDANDSAESLELSADVSSIIGDGQWHQYTLTVGGGGGSAVYIDGVLRATDANGGDAFNPTGSVYLGTRSDLQAERFYGEELDSVAVYGETLTAGEVADLYSGGTSLGTVNMTVNALPVITSGGGGATAAVSHPDTTTAVATVVATDANAPAQTLSYSISGGADAAKFTINSSTGALSFISAPSFDAPTDVGANNVYDVTVQVSDGAGGTDTQAVAVTVYKKAIVGFQAEHYNAGSPTGAGFTTVTEGPALNGEAITSAGNDTNNVAPPADRVAYTVRFPDAGTTNTYKLYVRYRLLTDTADDDSGWAIGALDGNPAGTGWDQINNLSSHYPGTGYVWLDLTSNLTAGLDKVAAYANVTAGLHTFYFAGRENGLIVDSFVFSTVPDLDLTAAGQAELDAAVNDRTLVTPTGSSRAYTENAGAIAVDNAITVTDADSATLTGAIVQITGGYQSTQDVLAYAGGGGITASWNSASGTLTLSGTASVAAYQAALRAVTYANGSDDPNTGDRTVSFTVDDGTLSSLTATRTVTVAAVNDAPTVTAASAGVAYTENQSATVIDAGLTVADVDSTSITGATVRVATNFAAGQDVLAFTNANGITGSYDPATGILTLSGTATIATYQAALRTITYANTSEYPSTLTRQVTFTVTDGAATSSAAQVPITVASVNDAPTVATAAAATPSTVTATTTALSVLGADDAGQASLTYTWVATTKPAGSTPTFSANGTNAAKASTVTFDRAGSYTFTVTISDGTLTTTSAVSVTVSQTLTTISLTPGSSSLNLNGSQQFAAVAYDQFAQAMASQPTFTWSKSSGLGSIDASGLYSAPSSGPGGSAVVAATSGSVSGTASITITNAAPTIATAAAASPTSVTGTTTSLNALGADDAGEPSLTYTWTATTKPAGSTPTYSANGTNAAKASTVTFDRAGSYTFQVTVSDGTSSTTSSVSVTVGQTMTTIDVSPSSTSLNERATQAFTAIAYDQFAQAMASQPTFTWSKTAGVGSINASTGVYTAPGTTGTATIQATSGSVSDTASITVNNAVPSVATAAAATPSPVTGTTTALSVLGADDNGESNLTYTWAATTKPAGSNPTFSANGTNASKASTVTFDRAGAYAFTVTISDGQGGSMTSVVNVTVNQTLTTITVSPGSTALNLTGTQAFTAAGFDQFGDALSSPPTFTWSKTAGVGTINATTGVYTAPASAGTATIEAASGGVSDAASVTVTNAGPTVATPAAASPATVTATTSALSVLGADDNGEANLTYTWAATAKPAGSTPTFSVNGTNAAKASTVTFDRAGSYTFTVTISDGTLTTTSTVNVTVNQTIATIAVSPGSASLNLNQTQAFSAIAYDQFAQAMVTPPAFTWSKSSGVGSIHASSGLYSSGTTAGAATVAASSGGVSGTATVAVGDETPTIATAAAASPATVTGTTTALSVLGDDDGGEANLTYTWAATTKPAGSTPTFSANGTNAAKASTVTFDRAGTYTFTVTVSDGTSSTTTTVNVTVNQTLTSVTVSPATANVAEMQAEQFAAVANDQFGDAMATQPTFTWSVSAGVGTVDASGLYVAPRGAGSATVQATTGGMSGTAAVTVTDSAPTVATPAAATPSPVTGTTTSLSVLGADDGGETGLTYTWAVTAKPGGASDPTFSANGTNAAKASTATFSRAGSYTFTVTISDGVNTTTSAVTVVVNQTLTTITVSPASQAASLNQARAFTAVAYDQFAVAMSSQPTFTWTVQSGPGTINASGSYTSATIGTATVRAASGAVGGTASVTVSDAAPTVATPAAATPAVVTGTTSVLTVLGADDGGEANLTYTWAVTTKPGGAPDPTFDTNGINAAKSATATFAKVGSYTFTVTISDGTASVTSTVNVTVSQTLTSIVVTPADPSLGIGDTHQFNAVAYDQFDLAMASQPTFTWDVSVGGGSVDVNGLFTASAGAGPATVSATSGSVSGESDLTVVNNAEIGVNPNPVSGTTANLFVAGPTNPLLSYTWSVLSKPAGAADPVYSVNGTDTAKNVTATFDQAGSYTVQVVISDGGSSSSTTATFVVRQTLTSVSVTPASSAVTLNQTSQLAAAGYDQFGDLLSVQPAFTWAVASGVGSVDGSGLYSATSTAGTATVRATSTGISGTATVVVGNTAPTVATPAAATPNIVTGTTAILSVLGADDGGEAGLTYTWATTTAPGGASPTFTPNGTNNGKSSTVTFDRAGNYSFTVTITDPYGMTVTSVVSVTVDQTLSSIAVSPSSSDLDLNATQSFSAAGFDQFGDAMGAVPTFTWDVSAGGGSVDSSGVYTAPGTTGAATVRATSGGVSGTAAVTIDDAAPTIATPAAAAPSPVTGTTTTLSVLGADDGGEANLTYTWAATTKPAGSTPTFGVNGTNAAKTSVVTFDRAGSYTFTVTVSDGTNTTTSLVSVTVAQTLTSITVSPASASLDLNGTRAFSAAGFDQFARAMTTPPTFTWDVVAGVGTVDASGLYTSGATVGSATVEASSGGVSGTASVTVGDAAPTVATPAAATPAAVTGTTSVLSVLGADDGGEGNLTYTWAATVKPAGATPAFSVNGTNGSKSSTVTFDRAGSYTFVVTISDGTSSTTSTVSVSVSQTLSSIVVSPATASVNLNGTQAFAAAGYDQFGVAMAAAPTYSWSIAAGVGSVSAAGLYTAGSTAGTATVEAASGGVSGTATVTITNAAPTIATAAAAAPSTVSGTTTALSVLGADDDGGEPNLTYTWAATTKPAGSTPTFSANGTNAAQTSTVTFDRAGTYTFTVTISDGSLTTTDTVTVTVNQTLTSIAVSPATPSLNLNDAQAFAAAGYDQFGDLLASQPTFTWAVVSGAGSIDAGGVYTATASSGSAVVRAVSGGVQGTATVTVANAAPTVAAPAAAAPASVSGTTSTLSVLGADDNGESNLTYTWSATTKPAGASPVFDENGTNAASGTLVTFDRAGSYTFTVTISDGSLTTTTTVNLTVNQTLTSIAVSPASASLDLSATQQFAAVGYDQFGDEMGAAPTFTWTRDGGGVGSIDAAGLYSAGSTPGSAVVRAASGAVSGTATVAVANAAPTITTPATATPSPVTGTSTALSVVADDDGGEANLTYTWAATTKPAGATPTFSANGTNAAKSSTVTFDRAGTYTFTVTVFDGASSTTSLVSVTVDQTLTSVAVTPASAGLNLNGTQALAAVAYDQFAIAMAAQPTFTWALDAGVGSVDSGGVYTAPASGNGGSATVSATTGGVGGTATITVTNAAPTIATAAAAAPATVTATTTTLTVLGADDAGEPGLTYTWAATGKPIGSSPAFSANGTNAAKSSVVTFDEAGTYTFTVTISDGTNTTTSTVIVTVAQTATTIAVSPATVSLDLNGTQAFTAVAYDQFGDAFTTPPAFAWTKTSGVGSIAAGTGVYTAGSSVGTATIQVTSGSATATASVTVTNAAPTVATPAAAAASPVTTTSTTLSVLGADDGGESNLTYTWAATAKPAGSSPTFGTNGSNAAKSSVVTFDRAGSYTFTVTISDGSLTTTSSVTVTVDQTLAAINLTPASATVTRHQSVAFTPAAVDQFGNPMAVAPAITWSVISGVGSVDSGGLFTAGAMLGTAQVEARSGAVTRTATVTVANAGPTLATPAAATPSPVTGTSTGLSVVGADDNGEAGLTYTWSATTKPSGAGPTFSANGTNAAKDTTVSFDRAGTYTFLVTISDGTATTTSSVSVTVEHTLTSIVAVPGSATVNLNGSWQFAAVAYDQFNDALPTQPTFTWAVTSGSGSVNASGLYTAGSAVGSATIEASVGSVAGTATAVITDAGPTIVSPASAPAPTIAGTNSDLDVLGGDDSGESNLTYTWAATTRPAGAQPSFSVNGTNAAKHTNVLFDRAGTYTFTVTVSDGSNAVTSAVTIVVSQALTTLIVAPLGDPLLATQTRQFAAQGYDQFAQPMSAMPAVTWAVTGAGNAISGSGLFTAGATPGTYTVTGTSGSVSGSVQVSVANSAPTVATAAAMFPRSGSTTTANLSVLGGDDTGEAGLTYTWSTTGKPAGAAAPLFSANGTHAARDSVVTFAKAGTYTFTVAISDGSLSVLSSVTVVVAPSLAALAITPDAASIDAGESVQLEVTALDQFQDPMSLPGPADWSVDGEGGVSDGGRFTASDEGGTTSEVVARIGAVSARASITVARAAPKPPEEPQAQQLAEGEIEIIWSGEHLDAEQVVIERSTDGQQWENAGTVDGDETHFRDSGLASGTTYFYRLLSVRDGRTSEASEVVQAQTPQPPLPPSGGGSGGNAGGGGSSGGGNSGGGGVIDPGGGGGGGGIPSGGGSSGGGSIGGGGSSGGGSGGGGGSRGGSGNSGGGRSGNGPNGNGKEGGDAPAAVKADTGAPKPQGNNAAPAADPNAPAGQQQQQSQSAAPGAGVPPQGADGQGTVAMSRGSGMVVPQSAQAAVATAQTYSQMADRAEVQAAAQAVTAQQAKEKEQQQVVTRAVATVTATAVTGYVLWLVQGGALVISIVSAMPFWRWFDPLPVLDSWEKSKPGKRRPKGGTSDTKGDADDDEEDDDGEEELDGIVE